MFTNTFQRKIALGKMLLRKGLVSQEKIEKALVEQRQNRKPLGKILVEKNLIPQETLDRVLGEQNIKFGQLLLQEQVIFLDELKKNLLEQRRSNKQLGQLLVEKCIISQQCLNDSLEKQYWQKTGFWLI